MKPNPNTLEVVAHHEAGHAVMQHMFRLYIKDIHIKHDGNGVVNMRNTPPSLEMDCIPPEMRESYMNQFNKQMKRYAMVLLAGYCAEFRFLKRRMPYGITCTTDAPDNDFNKIRDEISKANEILGNAAYGEMHMFFWDKATRKEIRKPQAWEAITGLANALLKSKAGYLSGDAVYLILSKYLTTDLNEKYHHGVFEL